MTRIRVLLGGALLVIAVPAGAGGRLAMRVSPASSYEPATLIVQVSIEPDSDNLFDVRGEERAMVTQAVVVFSAGGR